MRTAPFQVPEITDECLAELAKQIKPVVRGPHDSLYHIKPCGLRTMAFTWDPKRTRKAVNLVRYTEISTLHTYGYYGLFKPTIAEVLAQIPLHLIKETVAFETIGPETAADLNREKDALNAGFHVATTYLYRRSTP